MSRTVPGKLEITRIAAAVVTTGGLLLVLDARSARGQEAEEVALPAIEVTPPAAPAAKAAPKQKAKSAPQSDGAPPSDAETEAETGPAVTRTTAGAVQGYRALTAVSATKTETPIEKIPQGIQVIPRSLIDDQTSISIDEAARNVSGVTGTLRLQAPAYDSGKIRGFFSEQRLDGMPTTYSPGHRDGTANIERIEVLKGPAVVYGGGLGTPVGGTLNVVSKMPFDTAATEIGATVGTDSYYRPYFDINQPLAADGSVLFRITGEYLDAASFVDHIETEAFAINPTLTLAPSRHTTLTIQGRASRWEQPEYQGLPATGTVAGDFRLDRSLFVGSSDAPDSMSTLHGVTVTLDHAVSDRIDTTVKARWTRSELTEIGQLLVGADGFQANVPLIGPSTWFLSNAFLDQDQDEFAIAGDLRFRSSGAWHDSTLVVGADWSRIAGSAGIFLDAVLGGAGFVDLTDPVFAPFVRPPKLAATAAINEHEVHVAQGLYVQLQTTLADRLHLLGGLRLADVAVEMTDYIDGSRESVRETRLLPRIGALVDLVDGLSAYASYSEGLTSYAIVGQRGLPAPERSAQREVGLKFDLGGGLSGTAALFQVDRIDTPIGYDLALVGTSDERARGAELDVIWQPNANWSVLGSYAYIDARILRAAAIAAPGARRIGVPEHSGRLWINHTFDAAALKGWSAGVGLYAASGQAVDLANQFFTDTYMTVDAKLAYTTGDFTITGSAKNLLDETYFISHFYLGGRVAPGDPRAFYLTVSRSY